MDEPKNETTEGRAARWAREDAAASTKREKNIVAKKRRQETKPADTTIEWRVVSKFRGVPVYCTGGVCGRLWGMNPGHGWDERTAKHIAGVRRENLQNWAHGVKTGTADEVEMLGGAGRPTRIERATGVLAREMFENLRLERIETNRWNLARSEWGVLEGW